MNRAELFGGILRGALSAGSWAHLTTWVKQTGTRRANLSLSYINGEANWTLTLKENDSITFEQSGPTLESVVIQAVAAVAKR
jgi:hypothetical protein